ncbi:DeoR/GlpR family DNA-binding transcription regulator [Microbacterium luticocti]|uniref:DeoR/GlpR family DNA-binding transcription regulator n=1 Tax=Microbacterium luticocti TaxID=451764 RepID=UPI0003F57179|nr:DeoR/GlpR family DNA-binding transcription regulator [Microbacterium luticocti]
MDREDRLSRLVDYIVEKGTVRVEEVIAQFGVSGPTARRDLDALAEQQLVERTRGGARANSTTGDVPLRFRTSRRWHEKNAIARTVASLVTPGSVIAFNGGTTTTAAAYEVGVRAAADGQFAHTETTVVTNAVNIANDLVVRPQLRIVVVGGVARSRSYELIGPLTGLILPEISIDTLFLGVTAVDPQRGLFTPDEGEAKVNAALVEAARRTVVVADSTKFAATAFARICTLGAVDAMVTDAGITDASARAIRDAGLELIIA